MRPTRRLRPKWLANWAAVKAPTPASVACANESCPPIPVMRVMERKMVAKAMPELKTFSQVRGIQVSMDTTKTARRAYQAILMTRSNWGARIDAVVGGVGGSMAAMGSRASSRLRSPGTKSSAAASTMNGSDGRTAE